MKAVLQQYATTLPPGGVGSGVGQLLMWSLLPEQRRSSFIEAASNIMQASGCKKRSFSVVEDMVQM